MKKETERLAKEFFTCVQIDAIPSTNDIEKAANHMLALQSRLESLEKALKKANEQAEHFEREWYLRGDVIESMEKDAARYRMLREKASEIDDASKRGIFERDGWEIHGLSQGDDLDAAIDAAMKG